MKPSFISIPIKDLTVSLEDFQGRAEAYSSVTYNRIKDEVRDGTFNFSALPAIMVWKDNRTNKWVILAGHSRTAIFSDLAKGLHKINPKYKASDFNEIHAQVFIADSKEDALEQAKKVAQESNLAGQQSDIDFAFNVVKPLREKLKGSPYWEKMKNLFGANQRKMHKLSFLNPDGKTVAMLRATADLSDPVQKETTKSIAEYIGLARERLPELTDRHENELYDWLVKTFAEEAKAKKDGRKLNVVISSEAKFLELLGSRVLRLGWTPDQPLNLDLVGTESIYKRNFDQEKQEKVQQIKDLQKKYDEDKARLIKANWSTADIEAKLDQQELYIIRLQRELAAFESKISDVQAAERNELSLFDAPPTKTEDRLLLEKDVNQNSPPSTKQYIANLKKALAMIRVESFEMKANRWDKTIGELTAGDTVVYNGKPHTFIARVKVGNRWQAEIKEKGKKSFWTNSVELPPPPPPPITQTDIDTAWQQIKPEVEKVKKEFSSIDKAWWSSRIHDFIYQGALKKLEPKEKDRIQKLFPQIWENYKQEFISKKQNIPDGVGEKWWRQQAMHNFSSRILESNKGKYNFSVLADIKGGDFLIKQLDYWLTEFEKKTEDQILFSKSSAYMYQGERYDPNRIRQETGYQDVDMLKQVCETAIHIFADSLIASSSGTADALNKLSDFYAIQPRVIWRTTKSMHLQQYSTPVPIAYLMSKFATQSASATATFLEPSAGTGMLTIGTMPDRWTINEIDPDRLIWMKFLGFKHTLSVDSTKPLPIAEKFDAILTNPPFSSTEKTQILGYNFSRKEFVMVARALDLLKENGRAAIIIGGHTKYDGNEITPHYTDAVFYNYLFEFFNVVDMINLEPNLYQNMGANCRFRIILIDGRKPKQDYIKPRFDTDIVKDFDLLYSRIKPNL